MSSNKLSREVIELGFVLQKREEKRMRAVMVAFSVLIVIALCIAITLAVFLGIHAKGDAQKKITAERQHLVAFAKKANEAPVKKLHLPIGQGTDWILYRGGFDPSKLSRDEWVLLHTIVCKRNRVDPYFKNWQPGEVQVVLNWK